MKSQSEKLANANSNEGKNMCVEKITQQNNKAKLMIDATRHCERSEQGKKRRSMTKKRYPNEQQLKKQTQFTLHRHTRAHQAQLEKEIEKEEEEVKATQPNSNIHKL